MILHYRKTLFSIILLFPTLILAQCNIQQYLGKWERTIPNKVILEINAHLLDSIEFTMTSHYGNYYGYLGGYENENSKYAKVTDSIAYFNDTCAISDGYPLYYEGEDPCKLWFKIIDENTIEVYEEDCYMIYGGAAITWGGEYERINNSYLLANDNELSIEILYIQHYTKHITDWKKHLNDLSDLEKPSPADYE